MAESAARWECDGNFISVSMVDSYFRLLLCSTLFKVLLLILQSERMQVREIHQQGLRTGIRTHMKDKFVSHGYQQSASNHMVMAIYILLGSCDVSPNTRVLKHSLCWRINNCNPQLIKFLLYGRGSCPHSCVNMLCKKRNSWIHVRVPLVGTDDRVAKYAVSSSGIQDEIVDFKLFKT